VTCERKHREENEEIEAKKPKTKKCESGWRKPVIKPKREAEIMWHQRRMKLINAWRRNEISAQHPQWRKQRMKCNKSCIYLRKCARNENESEIKMAHEEEMRNGAASAAAKRVTAKEKRGENRSVKIWRRNGVSIMAQRQRNQEAWRK
jgi:hypothetical protein